MAISRQWWLWSLFTTYHITEWNSMTLVLCVALSNTISLEKFKAESPMRVQFKADGAYLIPWAVNVSFYKGRDFWHFLSDFKPPHQIHSGKEYWDSLFNALQNILYIWVGRHWKHFRKCMCHEVGICALPLVIVPGKVIHSTYSIIYMRCVRLDKWKLGRNGQKNVKSRKGIKNYSMVLMMFLLLWYVNKKMWTWA